MPEKMPAGTVDYEWVPEYRVVSRMTPGRYGKLETRWRAVTAVRGTRNRAEAEAELARRLSHAGDGFEWALPENNKIQTRLVPVLVERLPEPTDWEDEL